VVSGIISKHNLFTGLDHKLVHILHILDGISPRLTIMKILLKATILISNFISIIMVVMPIVSPGIPPFLGYLLCGVMVDLGATKNELCGQLHGEVLWTPDLKDYSVQFLRVIGGFFSIVVYVPLMQGGMYTVAFELLPCLMLLKEASAQFTEEAKNILHSPHESGITLMRKYKELRLLTVMFNEIYQVDFFMKVVPCGILIIVSSGFFVISTYHLNPLVVAFGHIVITKYVILTLVFSLASRVWSNSVDFKSALLRNNGVMKRSLSKDEKSLQNLKIMVGSSNFIDRNTPFNVVSFCIEQTVSLLLLT
jgi:hypothetical protein